MLVVMERLMVVKNVMEVAKNGVGHSVMVVQMLESRVRPTATVMVEHVEQH